MHKHNNIPVFEKSLERINEEYLDQGLTPGVIRLVGIHPAWNTIVGDGGECGVAMSFRSNNPNYGDKETFFDPEELKPFVGMPISKFIRDNINKESVRIKSLVLAALNALSQPLITETRLKKKGFDTSPDLKNMVKKEDIVAIVGYGGLVNEYAGKCRELHVTDMRPVESFKSIIVGETVRYGPADIHIHSAEENEEVITEADVVFITGSTLANGTFEEVINLAENARVRCLYGSSAQLLPDALFESGINLVMSVAVTDPAIFEEDIMNSSDLETSLKRHQKKYNVSAF